MWWIQIRTAWWGLRHFSTWKRETLNSLSVIHLIHQLAHEQIAGRVRKLLQMFDVDWFVKARLWPGWKKGSDFVGNSVKISYSLDPLEIKCIPTFLKGVTPQGLSRCSGSPEIIKRPAGSDWTCTYVQPKLTPLFVACWFANKLQAMTHNLNAFKLANYSFQEWWQQSAACTSSRKSPGTRA